MFKTINDLCREGILGREKIILRNDSKSSYLLGLLISDLYKMSYYYGLADKSCADIAERIEQLVLYGGYDNFKLFKLCSIECITSAVDYNKLSLVDKNMLFEELENADKGQILNQINSFHFLDKMSCSFVQDLSVYEEFYKDYVEKNKDEENIVIEFLIRKLVELKSINYKKYKEFILEFIKTYYKCALYDLKPNHVSQRLYIKEIESTSLKHLYEKADKNYNFLYAILRQYLRYSNSEVHKKNDVNDYFNINSDKGIQKKLNFNAN